MQRTTSKYNIPTCEQVRATGDGKENVVKSAKIKINWRRLSDDGLRQSIINEARKEKDESSQSLELNPENSEDSDYNSLRALRRRPLDNLKPFEVETSLGTIQIQQEEGSLKLVVDYHKVKGMLCYAEMTNDYIEIKLMQQGRVNKYRYCLQLGNLPGPVNSLHQYCCWILTTIQPQQFSPSPSSLDHSH